MSLTYRLISSIQYCQVPRPKIPFITVYMVDIIIIMSAKTNVLEFLSYNEKRH